MRFPLYSRSTLFQGLIFSSLAFIIGSAISFDISAMSDGEDTRRESIAVEAPEERFDRAVELYYGGDTDLARGVLKDLVDTLAPEMTPEKSNKRVNSIAREAFRALVALYREAGEYDDARELIEGLNEDRKELMELYYLEGRPEEAISTFEAMEDKGMTDELDSRSLLIAARAYKATESYPRALSLIDHALEVESYLPTAHEVRGQILLQLESYEEAISAFEAARKQEPNLSKTLLQQARAHFEIDEAGQARFLLMKASGARPHDEAVSDLLAKIDEERSDLGKEEDVERAEARKVARPPKAAYHPDSIEEIPSIRVGLADSLGELWLKSRNNWEILPLKSADRDASPARNKVFLEGDSATLLQIVLEDGDLVFYLGEQQEDEMFRHHLDDGWLELRPRGEDGTTILFHMEHSEGQFSAGNESRAYRGSLRFGPSRDYGFSVVNTLDIESYLYSVVPSEMPASWPKEALRAQAVAARSYTVANLGRFDASGYDVSGSVRSAFYKGYSGESYRTTEAVDATRGQVLTYHDCVLAAYYSANNAGHTDSPEDVWGGKSSGIVGVADPQLEWDGSPRPPGKLHAWLFDYPESYSSVQPFAHRPAYRWEIWVDAEDIRSRLDEKVGGIRSILSEGRTPAGRVKAVRVIGDDRETRITGDSVRRQLGSLRSNLFVMEPVFAPEDPVYPRAFVFRGAGWGHGIGLDQTGAAGYAAEGGSAEEILEHYFPEADLDEEY